MTSCKEQDEVKNILTLETEPAQTYSITLPKDTIIIGKKGTRIRLPQGCFVDSTGKQITGPVKITLKEYYSIQDFIGNRLSTKTTDGRILTSSGMIFLEAKSENKSLQLKDTSPATIMFPRLVDSDVANLFIGQVGNNNEMQWQQLEPVHYDTIVIVKEVLRPMSDGVVEELYKEKLAEVEMELQFVIGSDTIPLTDGNQKQFDKLLRRTSGYINPGFKPVRERKKYTRLKMYDTLKFYIFETSSLGYINCDIFVEEKLYPFTVQVKDTESDVFIVLDSLNSVIYPDSVINVRINNTVKSSRLFNLPKNKSITVVSYRADEGNGYHFGVTRSNTSKKEVMINDKPKTLDEIKDAIKQL